MKIAVVGSGISGLSAAHFLSKKYTVDLFEKEDHFGGHAFTVDIPENNSKTFAEMSLEEKSIISHRKIAITKLKSFLF